jgi:hypothetical protein
MNEEVQQKSDWRARLMADVLSNMHDEETRAELLIAGLDQAHSEGVEDAAFICDGIAHQAAEPRTRKVATTIAKALREYDARNKSTRAAASLGQRAGTAEEGK